MTQKQTDALIALFAAADNAACEEVEFWDNEQINDDHRPPAWLDQLCGAVTEARAAFGFEYVQGVGWKLPRPVFRDTLNPIRICVPMRVEDHSTTGNPPIPAGTVTCG